jgi:hypothetical protein
MSNKRRRSKQRSHTVVSAARCRAFTQSGHQCTRSAVVTTNLNREWGIGKIRLPIPRLKCCVLCTQHLNELARHTALGLVQAALEGAAGPDVKAVHMAVDPRNERSILRRVYTSLLVR